MPRPICTALLLLFLAPGAGAACFFFCDLSEPPAYAADSGPLEIPVSKMAVPVGVSLAPFAAQLNAELPERVHTIAERIPGPCVNLLFTKACADIDLAGWVDRAGLIEIWGQDDQVIVEIPLHAQVTARGTGDVGKRIRETATAALTVTATIGVAITPDWRVEADVVTRYHWDQPPQIKVAGQTITFRRQVDGPVQDYLRSLEQQLARQIENGFDLRAQAELVWSRLFEPRKIADEDAWVRLEPLAVSSTKIDVSEDRASLVAGLDARVEVVWRQRPEPVASTPLPPLKAREGPPGIELMIPLRLPYEDLGRVTRQRLSDELLSPLGRRAFAVDGLQIYPAGTALAVALTLAADFPDEQLNAVGTVYLTATPEVRDTELVLASPEWSPGAADGVLGGLLSSGALEVFKTAMSSRMAYDVDADMDALERQLEAALNQTVAPGVLLAGEVEALRVRSFQLLPQHLVAWFSVEGAGSLQGDPSALGHWNGELTSPSGTE